MFALHCRRNIFFFSPKVVCQKKKKKKILDPAPRTCWSLSICKYTGVHFAKYTLREWKYENIIIRWDPNGENADQFFMSFSWCSRI